MWRIIVKRNGHVLFFDGSEGKWIREEDMEKVVEHSNWRTYFMSLDFKFPEMWT